MSIARAVVEPPPTPYPAQGMHASDLRAEQLAWRRFRAGKGGGPKARPGGGLWGAIEFIRPTVGQPWGQGSGGLLSWKCLLPASRLWQEVVAGPSVGISAA